MYSCDLSRMFSPSLNVALLLISVPFIKQWRGGKRDPYENSKSNGLSEESMIDDENNGRLKMTYVLPNADVQIPKVQLSLCKVIGCGKLDQSSLGMAVPSLPPWVCMKCHISNPGNKRRCGGCLMWKSSVQNSKPPKSRASLGGANIMGEEASSSGGHWQCKKCNFDNFTSELKCFVCQAIKTQLSVEQDQQIISSSAPKAVLASLGFRQFYQSFRK
jgi:hypothetical protein